MRVTRIALLVLVSMAFGLLAADGVAAPARGPIELNPGTQLFIDDYLLAESKNLTRTTHQPETLADPILAKDEPWHEMPLFFLQVLRDPDTGLFRMWYNIRNNTPSIWTCYAYAESDDGIHWRRPNLGLIEIDGSKDNNIVWNPEGIAFGLFVVDDGKDVADPNHQYKMAYCQYGSGVGGIYVAFSPDGLHWTDYENNPVLVDEGWDPERKRYHDYTDTGDIMDGCWDPLRKRYLMSVEVRSAPEDGYKNVDLEAKSFRRLVAQSVSDDFVNWGATQRTMIADPNEVGGWQFYGMKPQLRGNLYLGFLRMLRDDITAEPGGPGWFGIGWTELCTSRDGENWTRHREPFLDRNPKLGTFDHAHAWFGDCVTVGDKEFIYYCGYAQGHKVGTRQIGLGFLRKDGFVSRDAGSTKGHLQTRLVTLHGSGITVNAEVEDNLRVRILDANSKPIPGFDWDDCQSIHGDSVRHAVQWSGNLADLKETPIRLEFALRKAKLYALDLVP